jgi:hypothetical protein
MLPTGKATGKGTILQLGDGTLYVVGEPYWPQRRPPYPEGIEFNHRCGYWFLTISQPHLTPRDMEALQGPAEFGVLVLDGLIFFLCRFGKVFKWTDCPYTWWAVPEDERTIPEPPTEPERALLSMTIVESTVNRIVGLRVVTLPKQVTLKLIWAIMDESNKPFMGQAEYDRRLKRIRDAYTPAELAKMAVTGRGGE